MKVLAEIWRYPVQSLDGEHMISANIVAKGVADTQVDPSLNKAF